MKTEYGENVSDNWKLPIEIDIVKMKRDGELDDVCDFRKTLPGHLGAFILSNSQIIINNFIREGNCFFYKK